VAPSDAVALQGVGQVVWGGVLGHRSLLKTDLIVPTAFQCPGQPQRSNRERL
jgi:hypothetical protein